MGKARKGKLVSLKKSIPKTIALDMVDMADAINKKDKRAIAAVAARVRVPLIPIYVNLGQEIARSVIEIIGEIAPLPAIEIDCRLFVVEYTTDPVLKRKTVFYGGKMLSPVQSGGSLPFNYMSLWPDFPWVDGLPPPESSTMLYSTFTHPAPVGYRCKTVIPKQFIPPPQEVVSVK